jgi:hypothetical protein
MKKAFLITLFAVVSFYGFAQTGNLDFLQKNLQIVALLFILKY